MKYVKILDSENQYFFSAHSSRTECNCTFCLQEELFYDINYLVKYKENPIENKISHHI